MKSEGRKKGIKATKKARVASGLILIFAILYVPSLLFWVYSGSISTDIVKYGNLEDSINLEGYLFRNEFVLKSEQKGIFFSEVNEGERVQAFSQIASVLNDNNRNLINELNLKDQKLIECHREISQKSGTVTFEVQKIDDEISKKMEEIVLADNLNDISSIVGLKSQIETLIKKKVEVISSLNIKDDTFNKAKEERNESKKNIDSNTAQIKASASGMVSYMVDGFEEKLNFDSIKGLKPKDLEGLTNNSIFMIPEDSHIEEKKPFAKIITDSEYYIVFATAADTGKSFKAGSVVKVRLIPVNRTISGIVNYISEEIEGQQIISIKVDRALAETSGYRKLNISIIKSSYSGFKIPIKSLVEFNSQDKKAKIMVLKGGIARLVDVIVVGFNSEFAIVDNDGITFNSGINLYDTYVVDGKNVKEGQFIY